MSLSSDLASGGTAAEAKAGRGRYSLSPIPRTDQRRAVKNDAFLPSDESELSSSDSEASLKKWRPRSCPCCHQRIRLHGNDYHQHLFWCLKNECKAENSLNNAKESLQRVERAISQLDLTLRINTMESLIRMGKSTADTSSLISKSERNEKVDEKVLALVYGKPRGSASNTKIQSQNPKKRKRGRASDNSKRRKTSAAPSKKANAEKMELHTPTAVSKPLRAAGPMSFEDIFHVKSNGFFDEHLDWNRNILHWHENNRTIASISLPQSPFA